jgi:hypothetical protein
MKRDSNMKAYDIFFERDGKMMASDPEYGPDSCEFLPVADAPSGWIGSDGPGIDPATWPRGPETGLPMFHALTLRLPPEYQRRGPEFPGIAFFQGEGEFAEPYEEQGEDPFVVQVKQSRPHAQLCLREDLIGGKFALLWLTKAELAAGPTSPPPDPRRPGEHGNDDGGPNAWDEGPRPVQRVWLVERDDPNAGLTPVERFDPAEPKDAYRCRWTEDFDLEPWAQKLAGRCHLGGTVFHIQALPEGLTPWYLELTELPGLNFGGGNAQIDLESDTFDWACD